MWDVDTSPTWRLLGSSIWGASCFRQHASEVAADPFLTTHLIAAAVLVGLPQPGMLYAVALQQSGAADPINAMHDEGLEAALLSVQAMDRSSREQTVVECAAVVLKGWNTLQSDIHDRVVRGVKIARDASG